jgi:hypothetical protein
MKTVTISEKDFQKLLSLAWAVVNDGLATFVTENGVTRTEDYLTKLEDETPVQESK